MHVKKFNLSKIVKVIPYVIGIELLLQKIVYVHIKNNMGLGE